MSVISSSFAAHAAPTPATAVARPSHATAGVVSAAALQAVRAPTTAGPALAAAADPLSLDARLAAHAVAPGRTQPGATGNSGGGLSASAVLANAQALRQAIAASIQAAAPPPAPPQGRVRLTV